MHRPSICEAQNVCWQDKDGLYLLYLSEELVVGVIECSRALSLDIQILTGTFSLSKKKEVGIREWAIVFF